MRDAGGTGPRAGRNAHPVSRNPLIHGHRYSPVDHLSQAASVVLFLDGGWKWSCFRGRGDGSVLIHHRRAFFSFSFRKVGA